MEIKTFIENSGYGAEFHQGEISLSELVLKPDAWENNGKVEGWFIEESEEFIPNIEWQQKMHQMIDHICEGGTAESYIKTLK